MASVVTLIIEKTMKKIFTECTTVGSKFVLGGGGGGLISLGWLLGHYFPLKLYRIIVSLQIIAPLPLAWNVTKL
jgi:hypothetical protein